MGLIIGYVLAFFIGIVINLLGGGGSILSIPILVYIIGIDPYTATSYSLFLVGISSWTASINNIRHHQILYKEGLVFSIPVLLVTFLIRKYMLPVLPDILLKTNTFTLTKGSAILSFFVLVMLITSIYSIKGKNVADHKIPIHFNYFKIIIQGTLVGIITGFVGAGGGFLIIPALAFLLHFPMKNAIATSLFIMAITTSLGFLSDFGTVKMDWSFLLFFLMVMMTGIFVSNPIKAKISNKTLKTAFGYFILLLSFIILFLELSAM